MLAFKLLRFLNLNKVLMNVVLIYLYQTTLERVLPYWEEEIMPNVKAGKKILIAAHGNSLRALVKHLDKIPEDVIAQLNIPTGVPLVYEFDEDTFEVIPQENAISPLQGRYLGDQENIRARIQGVKVK
jgi:2,3-bisphosphoglycerate-dependent phosphoglycerate mutase